eukprot:11348884-Heterocapsa_arctica.AAC.1
MDPADPALLLAEAHYRGHNIGFFFRELIFAASWRPIARPLMATRRSRQRDTALRAAYALATVWRASWGCRPCDRCGEPTSRWCRTCGFRLGSLGHQFDAEPLCRTCEEELGSCFLCSLGCVVVTDNPM